ncbi:MAG: ABC transporter permease subunit [Clostridia bacterium]|nr:ABC transporter permease subunit [Clostridia bacterium]
MKAYLKRHFASIICGIIALVIMWAVWFIACKIVKNEYVIPSVKQTFGELFKLLGEAFFYRALLRTLEKSLIAFVISFVLAGSIALPSKLFKGVDGVMRPIIAVIRTLPTMAVLIPIILYTNRFTAPIIVAMLVLFPMIYAQFKSALDNIDEQVVRTAKVFKLTRRQKVVKVYFPLVAPNLLSHTGSNLSFAIKVVISAEVMVMTYTSIGGMIQYAGYEDLPRLFALTLFAVIIGIVIETTFHLLSKKLFKWTRAEGKND